MTILLPPGFSDSYTGDAFYELIICALSGRWPFVATEQTRLELLTPNFALMTGYADIRAEFVFFGDTLQNYFV